MKEKKVYNRYKSHFATRNWMKRHLQKRTVKKGRKYDKDGDSG
jgi:hypothetical protein